MKKRFVSIFICIIFVVLFSSVSFASIKKEYWVKNTYSPHSHLLPGENSWTYIPEDYVISYEVKNNGMFKLVYKLEKADSSLFGTNKKTVTVESSIENIIVLTIEEE